MGLKTFTNLISCITIITIKPTSFTRAAVSFMRLPKPEQTAYRQFVSTQNAQAVRYFKQDTLFSMEAMGISCQKLHTVF